MMIDTKKQCTSNTLNNCVDINLSRYIEKMDKIHSR